MRGHKSTHSYSPNKSSSEGYKPMNKGRLHAGSGKMSRPDVASSPAQGGVANDTYKNKA